MPMLTKTTPKAVTSQGIMIRSPNYKGKGKAWEGDNEMEVDPSDVPLSKEEDVEGKLEEFLEEKQDIEKEEDELKAA